MKKPRRNRVEFSHRGRWYGVFFPGGGPGHVLKRHERVNGSWVWRIIEKPSDGLWAAADQALDRVGVVL
jgi:hypothetical protein